jgi:hypothetical protein
MMAMIVGLATGPVLAAGIPDHLKCYKIKDPIILSGVLDVAALGGAAPHPCADGRCRVPRSQRGPR